ncbi:MAG: phosphoribosylformylglycinamidine synthase subunit PurS [Candidatus Limnocylindrales bacterium]
MSTHRFAVNVTPKPGILDPQGRAVEGSLGHLGIDGVSAVRVGRRVELTVDASDEGAARTVVERLAAELLVEPTDRGVRHRIDRRRVVDHRRLVRGAGEG